MPENWVLRKILETKWRKLFNENLHDRCTSRDIITAKTRFEMDGAYSTDGLARN
jgi:hypothetical protein